MCDNNRDGSGMFSIGDIDNEMESNSYEALSMCNSCQLQIKGGSGISPCKAPCRRSSNCSRPPSPCPKKNVSPPRYCSPLKSNRTPCELAFEKCPEQKSSNSCTPPFEVTTPPGSGKECQPPSPTWSTPATTCRTYSPTYEQSIKPAHNCNLCKAPTTTPCNSYQRPLTPPRKYNCESQPNFLTLCRSCSPTHDRSVLPVHLVVYNSSPRSATPPLCTPEPQHYQKSVPPPCPPPSPHPPCSSKSPATLCTMPITPPCPPQSTSTYCQTNVPPPFQPNLCRQASTPSTPPPQCPPYLSKLLVPQCSSTPPIQDNPTSPSHCPPNSPPRVNQQVKPPCCPFPSFPSHSTSRPPPSTPPLSPPSPCPPPSSPMPSICQSTPSCPPTPTPCTPKSYPPIPSKSTSPPPVCPPSTPCPPNCSMGKSPNNNHGQCPECSTPASFPCPPSMTATPNCSIEPLCPNRHLRQH